MPKEDGFDERLLAQMLTDFLEEAQGHLDRLGLLLTRLEADPYDKGLIDEVFRIIHTLKGSSSFVGLNKVTRLAHQMEDIFAKVRQDALSVTPPLMDLMYEASQQLSDLMRAAQKDGARAQDEAEIGDLLSELEAISEGGSGGGPQGAGTPGPPRRGSRPGMEVDLSARSVRVSIKSLDAVMNLTGELVTLKNRLDACTQRLQSEELQGITDAFDRLARQWVREVAALRMVSMRTLLMKFPPLARNLGREGGKPVRLEIGGEETRVDRDMIQHLYDPLVHLIRNAVDHGIEPPETRKILGKPETGTIRLFCSQREEKILIEVSDDGKGIQADEMKEAALSKGVITRKRAAELSNEEALQLIFVPGLTTLDDATSVSGRGVGMDIVDQHIRQIRGSVEVHTSRGTGTTFLITLPATLLTLKALIVRLGGRRYGIPLHLVSETMRIREGDIRQMEKREVIFSRGSVLPLKSLGEFLEIRGTGPRDGSGGIPVVIIDTGGRRTALWVHELLGKQDLVMKPLGRYPGRVTGVEGATILGDGSVALVLDMEGILASAGGS